MNFLPTRPIEEIYREFLHAYESLYSREAYMERSYHQVISVAPKSRKRASRLPRLFELRALFLVLFRYGIKYTTRFKFWKYGLSILWNHPNEISRFIDYCVAGEHYFEFRQTIINELPARPDT